MMTRNEISGKFFVDSKNNTLLKIGKVEEDAITVYEACGKTHKLTPEDDLYQHIISSENDCFYDSEEDANLKRIE